MKSTPTAATAATPPQEGTHSSEPSASQRISAINEDLFNALALVEAIVNTSARDSSNAVRLAIMAAVLLDRATDKVDALDAAMGVDRG